MWWESHYFNKLSLKCTYYGELPKLPLLYTFSFLLWSFLRLFSSSMFLYNRPPMEVEHLTLSMHLHWIISFVALRKRIRGSRFFWFWIFHWKGSENKWKVSEPVLKGSEKARRFKINKKKMIVEKARRTKEKSRSQC